MRLSANISIIGCLRHFSRVNSRRVLLVEPKKNQLFWRHLNRFQLAVPETSLSFLSPGHAIKLAINLTFIWCLGIREIWWTKVTESSTWCYSAGARATARPFTITPILIASWKCWTGNSTRSGLLGPVAATQQQHKSKPKSCRLSGPAVWNWTAFATSTVRDWSWRLTNLFSFIPNMCPLIG